MINKVVSPSLKYFNNKKVREVLHSQTGVLVVCIFGGDISATFFLFYHRAQFERTIF